MEENIADALKMAGSVLLFVIGLSIAILSFSQARESIDIILSYSDRESLSISNDNRFYYLAGGNNNTNRYVGKETIIPAMYRAYKENYKIVFDFNDDYYLFKQNGEEINSIDLANQSIGSDLASRQFLDGIIYHNYGTESNAKEKFETTFKIKLNDKSLYTYLTDQETKRIIKESLGTYYIEDTEVGRTTWQETTTESYLNNSNKTEKRVITYTFEEIL